MDSVALRGRATASPQRPCPFASGAPGAPAMRLTDPVDIILPRTHQLALTCTFTSGHPLISSSSVQTVIDSAQHPIARTRNPILKWSHRTACWSFPSPGGGRSSCPRSHISVLVFSAHLSCTINPDAKYEERDGGVPHPVVLDPMSTFWSLGTRPLGHSGQFSALAGSVSSAGALNPLTIRYTANTISSTAMGAASRLTAENEVMSWPNRTNTV